MRALIGLGLGTGLRERGVEYAAMELHDPLGRRLLRYEPAGRAVGVSMHRADLHAMLLSALPPERLSLHSRCQGFTPHADGVALNMEGGEPVEVDLLVAADGLHSTIRGQLHLPGDNLRYAGYSAWRGVVAGRLDGSPTPVEMWGPGQRFGFFQVSDERVAWWATANCREGLEGGPPSFQGWAPRVHDLIGSTAPEDVIRTQIYDRRPLNRWVFHDRVVLLGDAAHPTTPNLGQGACLAIEDAMSLASHLSTHPLAIALKRHQQERLQHCNRIAQLSRLVGVVGQLENPLWWRARNILMTVLPRRFAASLLAWVMGPAAA